ncbi:predicted protein [Uncinocarpus reesii 1704]|uniref:Altered inheritance of mitochondria protein 21 n=1 Tax=Uncinocarpus reesii (strain UAMH 1704) TaxID=336963 RepID=C4JYZ4_UNCRE|nr:uncharacterized protein UREG_07395 [Uncinocarpus reesii 1704]EEP82530.1 predicted protein [Uncinocarpus reesii 1704]
MSPPNPDVPKIPPRPTRRRSDRPISPMHDTFAPSPLNALPGEAVHSNTNPPSHPPSVAALPSVGQEGMEYESIDVTNGDSDEGEARDRIQQPAETRGINQDLHLYAPKPSLPGSSAMAQVEVVTRTDSRQAEAAGFGKSASATDEEGTQNRKLSAQNEPSSEPRKSEQLEDEHGIPEIGQRAPMIPNAGDVQAPTPATLGAHNEGYRGDNSGSQRQQHARNRSARENSLPPGSYGLHGHGVPSNDKFEKAWYEKHPEELAREEQGHYGSGIGSPRPEWVMSSDDLNKMVKSSATKGIGLDFMGTPEEEIGYIATEELASRLASPPHGSKVHQQDSQNIEAATELPKKSSDSKGLDARKDEHSPVEPTREDNREEVKIHIDEPIHHQHHPDGFMPAPDEPKPPGDDSLDDYEKDVPILAEDEIDERAEHLQPAISPALGRKENLHGIGSPEQKHSRSPSVGSNRTSARPLPSPKLLKYSSRVEELEDMRRPLEDVEEYEPLFPDDDKDENQLSVEQKLAKHPGYHQHKFPSKDVWEDAPDSLQLQTTVSIPESPKDESTEIPEEEMARNRHYARKKSDQISTAFSNRADDVPARSQVKQRFPSKDIWEEAPESQQLETTVQIPEQQNETISPEAARKPSIPEVPSRPSKRPQKTSPEPQAPPPQVESTVSPAETKKPPAIPERPKPQIPPRPARPPKRTSQDSLTKVTSTGSSDTAPVKPKPPVPSRPLGSKIAALKAGFLSDLDNRLKLGPQAPKPEEKKDEEKPEVPKGPLSDARKGRARGPARRKPAVSSTPENTMKEAPQAPQITLVEPWNVWSMGSDGILVLCQEEGRRESLPKSEQSSIEQKETGTVEPTNVEEEVKNGEPESRSPEPQDSMENPKPESTEDQPDLPAGDPTTIPHAPDSPTL